MDSVSAFCWTMVDLDACIRSTYHYHQLRIAGLLRLLVFDEYPLVNQVNRVHKAKLRFSHRPGVTATRPSVAEEIEIGGTRTGIVYLDPATDQGTAEEELTSSLSSWLKLGAFRLAGRVLTVQEFTKQMAYVEGLTHASSPRDDEERQLVAVRNKLRLADFSDPSLFVLKQIGTVTHAGLRPLFDLAKLTREREHGPYPTFTYEMSKRDDG
jgi:hypothetical protein